MSQVQQEAGHVKHTRKMWKLSERPEEGPFIFNWDEQGRLWRKQYLNWAPEERWDSSSLCTYVHECRDTYGFVCYVSGMGIHLFSKFRKKTIILGELSMTVYRPISFFLLPVKNSYYYIFPLLTALSSGYNSDIISNLQKSCRNNAKEFGIHF